MFAISNFSLFHPNKLNGSGFLLGDDKLVKLESLNESLSMYVFMIWPV